MQNASYGPNIECIWDIRVTPGYTLDLDFIEQLDVETSTNCQNDYVQVREFFIEAI